MISIKYTVRGYNINIFNHLAINSTTAVAGEARVNPAVVEIVSAHTNKSLIFSVDVKLYRKLIAMKTFKLSPCRAGGTPGCY